MAITFDTKALSTENNTTLSYTMGSGTHSILIVIVASVSANGTLAQDEVSTLTYNGVSMTFLGRDALSEAAALENAEVWYMIDPPSGAHNIVVTLAGGPSGNPHGYRYSAVSYLGDGDLTVSGFTHNRHATLASVTVSSSTGSLVIAGGLVCEQNITSSPTDAGGQTSRENAVFAQNGIANFDGWVLHSEKAGGSSVTISWTTHSAIGAQHMLGFSIDESVVITGSGAAALVKISMSGSGISGITGTGAATLKKVTISGSGSLKLTGSGALSLVKLAFAGSGLSGALGSGATILAKITMAGSGLSGAVGSGATTLAKIVMSGAGSTAFLGSGAVSLAKIAMHGLGGLATNGIGAVSLRKITMAGLGTHFFDNFGIRNLIKWFYLKDNTSSYNAANVSGAVATDTLPLSVIVITTLPTDVQAVSSLPLDVELKDFSLS